MKNIVEYLITNNQTISTMESCTGGHIVNEITNIEGASQALKYSAITYSTEAKIKMGVKKSTIEKYSVYSKEVAEEMSKSICDFSSSTYGIGITGHFDEFQEGLNEVYVSIYNSETKTYSTSTYTCSKNQPRSTSKQQFTIWLIKFLADTLHL